MDPKLRICNLKIWEPEMLTRNHKKWLLGSFALWSPPPSEERVTSDKDTLRNLQNSLPSHSPWYSSEQQILTVHVQGGYCSQHQGYGAEQYGLSLPLTFSLSLYLPSMQLSQFSSVPVYTSTTIWQPRGLMKKALRRASDCSCSAIKWQRVCGHNHKVLLGKCNLSGKRTAHCSIQC